MIDASQYVHHCVMCDECGRPRPANLCRVECNRLLPKVMKLRLITLGWELAGGGGMVIIDRSG